jgi:hypothetical protein
MGCTPTNYESLRLQPLRGGARSKPREIIPIDDVITSGSAFSGAAICSLGLVDKKIYGHLSVPGPSFLAL